VNTFRPFGVQLAKRNRPVLVSIFHPDGNLPYNPNLSALVTFLVEDGFIVEYLHNPNKESPRGRCPSVRARKISFLLKKYTALGRKFSWLPSFFFKLLSFLARIQRPSLVIGVDREGIILASGYAAICQSPLAMISYEIYFASETGRDFKSYEITACSNLSFAVCQDSVRSSLLSSENLIPLSKIIDIPVSPASKELPSTYPHLSLRESLGISQEYIALYSGSIARWAMMEELLDTLSSWPANWALVLHGRYRLDSSINLVHSLRRSNVYTTNGLVLDEGSFVSIIRSVDLGLAFYQPTYESCSTGENIKSIGLSSGKISYYLSQSLPVYINKTGEISELVSSYNAGIVNSVENIASVLSSLDPTTLLTMKSSAYRLFSDKLNADLYRNLFLSTVRNALDS